MQIRFPENFWWGTASSATQSEGASHLRGKTTWEKFYELDPIRFHNEVGPETTSDFYSRYEEDIEIMDHIGLNSFRTSISWARLFPEKGQLNQEAVDFYNNVIDEQIKRGIEPFMCLYHFDTPMRLQDEGGWENRAMVEEFTFYARTCFQLFGDRVKHWFTFNEPILIAEGGYLDDRHYPGIMDFSRAVQVTHNVIVAHSKAVAEYKKQNLDGKVGIILNLTPSYPRSEHPADLEAARICDLLYNKSFLDPVVKGEYTKELKEFLDKHGYKAEVFEGDMEVISENKVDILGINFYYPKRVKAKEHSVNPNAPFKPSNFYDAYPEMKGRKINPHRGWEIYEKCMYDIAMEIKNNYGNIEWFISENGMGVEGEDKFRNNEGQIEDNYRIDFIKAHLKWLHKAMEEGANCKGYHLWTFCDNWSWINSYKNRYGFVEVDIENNCERKIKKSGLWIKDVISKGYVSL